MKLYTKEINLREKTQECLLNNFSDEDVQLFIQNIKFSLEKIKKFINNIDNYSPSELYFALKEFCYINFDTDDYLRILSNMNRKHYTDYITIKTYMVDKNGYNVEYFGATTKNNVRFDNEVLKLREIRELIRKKEFIILKKNFIEELPNYQETYENHYSLNLDIKSEIIDENSEIFKYAIELFDKAILKKEILYKLRIYYNEYMYQVRSITGLSLKNNEELKAIGQKYKDAYNKATNEGYIPKFERIIVNHKKNSLR